MQLPLVGFLACVRHRSREGCSRIRFFSLIGTLKFPDRIFLPDPFLRDRMAVIIKPRQHACQRNVVATCIPFSLHEVPCNEVDETP